MSDSVRPHRWKPTRLPHPWDSPGKNTGVGCHFLLQCKKVKSESEVAQSCPTLCDPMDCSLPAPPMAVGFRTGVDPLLEDVQTGTDLMGLCGYNRSQMFRDHSAFLPLTLRVALQGCRGAKVLEFQL